MYHNVSYTNRRDGADLHAPVARLWKRRLGLHAAGATQDVLHVCAPVYVCVYITTGASTVANTFCVDSRTAEAGPIPARPPTPSLAGLLLALRGGRPFGCPALPFVDDVLELVVYNNGLRTRLPVSFFV